MNLRGSSFAISHFTFLFDPLDCSADGSTLSYSVKKASQVRFTKTTHQLLLLFEGLKWMGIY